MKALFHPAAHTQLVQHCLSKTWGDTWQAWALGDSLRDVGHRMRTLTSSSPWSLLPHSLL